MKPSSVSASDKPLGLRFSVVIAARNAMPRLEACLDAVRQDAGPAHSSEVILVDDASLDDTAEAAIARGIRVVSARGAGPAAARNLGVAASRGDVVVFLDADCVPALGCLDALLAPFSDPAVSGVRGAYATDQRAVVARFVQLEMEEKQDRLAAGSRVTVVDTACAAYRRRVFSEHGGFDEAYRVPSVEDIEFSFRLVSHGEKLVYAPDARVRHTHAESLSSYCRRKFRFGFHRVSVYARYPARLGKDGSTPRLMPLQIVSACLLAMAAAASAWFEPARAVLAVAGAAFLASTVPVSLRAWRMDRPITPLVPPLVLARSLSQGLGLAAGFASMLARRGRRQIETVSPAVRGVERP